MFGWSRPTCPVDPFAKVWIEERLDWLSGEFGLDVFIRRAPILPTEDFFPDAYDASEEAVRSLFDRVCRYMDVNSTSVDLELFTDRRQVWFVNERGQYIGRAAGTYDDRFSTTVIRLETGQLGNPMCLVGTMAHELAHLRLLGEGRVSRDIYDNELLTDLTVVFHGLGIFLANVPRTWDSAYTLWPGTDLKKPEYLTLPMYGYALAHLAWFRDEPKPHWAKFLRMDVRSSFKQGFRFLTHTGESSFQPARKRMGL